MNVAGIAFIVVAVGPSLIGAAIVTRCGRDGRGSWLPTRRELRELFTFSWPLNPFSARW
jgi:hypothetical protein